MAVAGNCMVDHPQTKQLSDQTTTNMRQNCFDVSAHVFVGAKCDGA
jgi:hypothetical protein